MAVIGREAAGATFPSLGQRTPIALHGLGAQILNELTDVKAIIEPPTS